MKYLGLVCILSIFMSQGLLAQKTEKDFFNMLDGMYSYTVPLISPKDLMEKGAKQYLILDTREKGEFKVSHLPNAMCVGYDNFNADLIKDTPKDQPILVYCSVGYRSERIGEKLQEMGFKHVYNLYGGIFNWTNQGEKVVDDAATPTQNVHGYNREWSQWIFKGKKVIK